MRSIVLLLGCALASSLALADPPVAPSSPPAATPAKAEPSQASAQQSPAPAEPPAAAASTGAKAEPGHTGADGNAAEESRLRTAGYKAQMVNGVKVWCRTENSLGSRLAQQKNCGTAQDLERSVQETRNRLEGTQNRQTNPTYH
jgi:hypothetical protein